MNLYIDKYSTTYTSVTHLYLVKIVLYYRASHCNLWIILSTG